MRNELEQVCRLRFEIDGQEHAVTVGDAPLVIGRAPDCDLVLADDSISRRHAEIRREDGGWTIADCGSKNGIRINTYRTEHQVLRHGDRIDLGAVRLYVQIGPPGIETGAQVVFRDEKERGQRTEIIDMDRLGSLLGPTGDAAVPLEPVRAAAPLVADPEGPLRESGQHLRLFSDAAEALLSCDSLDETLERILALVFKNLPAERGAICLYDEETDTHDPKVTRTREGGAKEPILISSNIAKDVIKRKQALLVQDTTMDERFGSAHSVIMAKIHSAMCAPLYTQGRVAGFVYVDRQSDHNPFQAAHLQALSTLAILSAVAVEKAALRDAVRREQEIRTRLSRYSSPAVVEEIIQATVAAGQTMAAEERDVTVLFTDITGFTALTERLHSAEVVLLLNRLFERLTEAVFAHEGTLDKFRGDGMMAFFGAPLPMADHAERAVRAALRMQEELAALNRELDAERRVDMRIGINSGPVVVGDIGSPQRKDYTVIGDVVNTASRLESSVARPGQVVIGPGTFERLGPGFRCQPLEEVRLKGKQHTVRPYLVLGLD